MVPESRFVLIAAIVSPTPGIFAAAYICFTCVHIKPCSFNVYFKDSIKGFVFTIQMFAAFIAVVGAVMVIVAVVVLGDPNANRLLLLADGVQRVHFLAYGLVAGMFGILTGNSCICTQFYQCNCVALIGLQKEQCSELHTLYSLEIMYVYMYNSYKQHDLLLFFCSNHKN